MLFYPVILAFELNFDALSATCRRAPLRKDGAKRCRATANLRAFTSKQVVNYMLLYPQDAELQKVACEQLTAAAIETAHRCQTWHELQGAALLPVVINSMEVHWKSAPVVTAASRLLCCLANSDGHLRANIVAAGALPAVCVALSKHAHVDAVHALCDLMAEICSPRGSPPGLSLIHI